MTIILSQRIPILRQETINTCWYASMVMIVRFYRYKKALQHPQLLENILTGGKIVPVNFPVINKACYITAKNIHP